MKTATRTYEYTSNGKSIMLAMSITAGIKESIIGHDDFLGDITKKRMYCNSNINVFVDGILRTSDDNISSYVSRDHKRAYPDAVASIGSLLIRSAQIKDIQNLFSECTEEAEMDTDYNNSKKAQESNDKEYYRGVDLMKKAMSL